MFVLFYYDSIFRYVISMNKSFLNFNHVMYIQYLVPYNFLITKLGMCILISVAVKLLLYIFLHNTYINV